MGRHYYDDWDFYRFPKSTPREAKGGIKAQSKRGSFGETWWAKRWISVLESFNIGARLQRGRSYARSGQVLSIDVAQGKVTAKVQGSRATPYSVTIKVKTLPKADWQKLAAELGRQAIFAAKLLAGEMPQDIEEAFKAARLSLLPTKSHDLDTNCSCPDWSNPCKHIAAVYYLLGEEFDRDPFLIFRLRGIEREDLVKLLAGGKQPEAAKTRGKKRAAKAEAVAAEAAPAEAEEPEARVAEPLATEPGAYWGSVDPSGDLFGGASIPSIAAALPKRLGSLSFWRAKDRFLDAMEAVYRDAAPVGMDVFLGGSTNDESRMTKGVEWHSRMD